MNEKQIIKEIDEIEQLFHEANNRLHELRRKINFEREREHGEEA